MVFSSLDANHDGGIKVNEIVDAFQGLGITVSMDEALKLLKRYSLLNYYCVKTYLPNMVYQIVPEWIEIAALKSVLMSGETFFSSTQQPSWTKLCNIGDIQQ